MRGPTSSLGNSERYSYQHPPHLPTLPTSALHNNNNDGGDDDDVYDADDDDDDDDGDTPIGHRSIRAAT